MTQAIFKPKTHISEQKRNKVSVYAVNEPTASDYTNFEALYDEYSAKAFGFIVKHSDTKQEAEQLLSNVYLKIWGDIKSFEKSTNTEKKIIAIILSERRAFNQKKNTIPLSESRYFNWAYNTFMLGAVIYLFFLK
ncbi:MAG: hypothetical protein WKF91_07055 [Segetibacter sp.]